MNQLAATLTVLHAIDIDCPVAKALDFMHDAPQWLPWTMPAVKSVQPLPFGQWLVRTASGLAKLRLRHCAETGILLYELINPTAGAWTVPVQMVPTATGCHLAVTFIKPETLPLDAFEHGMQRTAQGLHTLKLVLEQD